MLRFFSHRSKQRALCPWRKCLPLNYTPNSSRSKSKLQSVHNKDNSICALWLSHFLLALGDFPFICAWLWKFLYGWMLPSIWLYLFLCGTLTHWFQCSGFEMVSWRMGDHGWSFSRFFLHCLWTLAFICLEGKMSHNSFSVSSFALLYISRIFNILSYHFLYFVLECFAVWSDGHHPCFSPAF